MGVEKESILPEYSVLMSVYAGDKREYLEMSIESMLKQTVPPEQFVVVIDGPVEEEIRAVLKRYAKEERELFTILPLKENGGLGRALNIGLQYCRNELVARMDADDISLPERCEKELREFVKNPELAVCGCNIDEFYHDPEDIRTSRVVPTEDRDIKKMMRRRQAFNHPTVIYRRHKVLEAGGYAELPRKEDFDLFSRMLGRGEQAKNIGESLYLYRAGQGNYARRKSKENLKSAIYVYWRHLRRQCCSYMDFLIICGAEVLFFVLPCSVVKWVSARLMKGTVIVPIA